TCTIKRFILGGENLQSALASDIYRKFNGAVEIYNEYGPTEATVGCMIYRYAHEKEQRASVPIGSPIDNAKIYLLDKCGYPTAPGVIGEVVIGGDGIAGGYLNRPELTAEKFGPQITQINKSFAGVKGELFQKLPLVLYKTGDLARWLKDGNIEFLGRIDQQVKIRGFRIELGEIESRLQQHKSIKEAVVLLCGEGADKHLCAYIVPGDPSFPMAADLRHDLAVVLPDYMVPSFFVTIDKIPLTPNGKIDRRALPEPGAGSMVEQYIAPGDIVEEKLVEIWAEVLGLPKNSISITANFFEIGGHSLKATTLLFKIHKAFEVKLPLSEFFKNSTVRALAEYIKKNSNTGECYARIAAVEKKEYYALSAAPLRLYILQQMEPLCTAYNMTLLIELTGRLQIAKLEETFKTLIARHESLRTSFFTQNEQVVQKVHQGVDFKIEIQVEGEERADKIQHMIRPFDLSRAPLIRAGLIPLAKEKHILLVDIHHIISDAISHRVLVHDFIQLYTGVVPAPLKLHYKDYCEWWQQQTGKEAFSRQEAYWLKQFEAKPPVLDLNCDYPRPPVQSVEGRSLNFRIEKGWAEALKKYALEEGVTLQMIMKAIFHILLAKLAGQDDIITGTTIAGRRHADLEKIIGLFVNTLPIRTFPAAGKVFQHYLQEVREISLNAYENQDYPFDGLAKKIAGQRSGRNPIFDIMFEIQLAETGTGTPAKIEMAGLEVRSLPTETNTTKFEQDWLGLETPDGIEFSVTYAIKLYRPETIELMTERFLRLIDSVLANPMSKIADLDYRTPLEKELNQVQAVCFNF
ncbi:MAG TPA: condensation domain-containing protein, partial [Candidatus Deferrimicrobium sp.]|nr:condensation domain-containing protein [Candidatus Deferrimicrobium sp.]